jgi:hypothetical protein
MHDPLKPLCGHTGRHVDTAAAKAGTDKLMEPCSMLCSTHYGLLQRRLILILLLYVHAEQGRQDLGQRLRGLAPTQLRCLQARGSFG